MGGSGGRGRTGGETNVLGTAALLPSVGSTSVADLMCVWAADSSGMNSTAEKLRHERLSWSCDSCLLAAGRRKKGGNGTKTQY